MPYKPRLKQDKPRKREKPEYRMMNTRSNNESVIRPTLAHSGADLAHQVMPWCHPPDAENRVE
jgi:hypothetical protein